MTSQSIKTLTLIFLWSSLLSNIRTNQFRDVGYDWYTYDSSTYWAVAEKFFLLFVEQKPGLTFNLYIISILASILVRSRD